MITREKLEEIIAGDKQSLKEGYLTHKDRLYQSLNDHSFFLDKALLTISTGAIFIFFSFSESLPKIFSPGALVSLKIVITLMGLVLMAVIASFILANVHFGKASEIVNDWYTRNHNRLNDALVANSLEELKSSAQAFEPAPVTSTNFAKAANCFNYIAYFLTFVSLAIVIVNIWLIQA